MTRVDHVALWVADLERARDFYCYWFGGSANGLYHNPSTAMSSYILTFGSTAGGQDPQAPAQPGLGTRLELMTRPGLATHGGEDLLGWAHVSFALPGRQEVRDLAQRALAQGVPVADGPRVTGDGYYEAVLLDPEGNRVEVVAGDYTLQTAKRQAY